MQQTTNAKFNLPGYDDVVDIEKINENFKTLDRIGLFNTGGKMSGTLDMGSQQLTNLAEPKADTDASTKKYSETVANNVKAVVDANKKALQYVEVTLPANGWSTSAPYTQNITVNEMTASWVPGIPVVVPGASVEVDIASRAAMACMTAVESAANKLIFTCYEKKPESDMKIRVPGMIG